LTPCWLLRCGMLVPFKEHSPDPSFLKIAFFIIVTARLFRPPWWAPPQSWRASRTVSPAPPCGGRRWPPSLLNLWLEVKC
jgi:hypothetical protein